MSIKDNTFGIADLQDKMLDIFKYFVEVCENNNLHYWLAGGTCLGAIRHGGFIPWDDDLDVYMPREDYEKLWQLKESVDNDTFRICRTTLEQNYHHRVMQLVDLNTTFIHSRNINEDIEHGVYIDIIPIDACPSGKMKQLSQIFNAIIFSIYNIQCKPEYNGGKLTGIMSFGTSVLLGLVRNKAHRYKLWKAAEKRMIRYNWDSSNYIKCITSQFHELMTPFPKAWFGYRKVPFEDTEAIIPSNAEAYLEKMYGDYMKLPEKEKQVVRHNTELIDLNSSFKNYKGKAYLINHK